MPQLLCACRVGPQKFADNMHDSAEEMQEIAAMVRKQAASNAVLEALIFTSRQVRQGGAARR